MECEKEDNVTWDLKLCRNLLRELENISQMIVSDCVTSFMNYIAKIFSTSYALLYRCYVTKYFGSKTKSILGKKKN